MSDVILAREHTWAETGKDLVAGAAGGVAQVLIGQPFDLVKVRLQTDASGNVLGVTRNIFVNEGPLAFYKGSLMPLLGIGACVSIQFGAFHSVRKSLEQINAQRYGSSNSGLSLGQYYLAGAAAGVANSVVSTPVEHIRIRLQLQPHGVHRIYSGVRDCMQQIYRNAGISGLYRGNVTCLLREFQGFGLWFLTYEGLLEFEMSRRGTTRNQIPMWKIALYGGLAGQAFWAGAIPFDVIKTKFQGDSFGKDMRYNSIRAAVIETWKEQQLRGFYRGLGPTLVRAMLTSAGTFVTAEQVRQMLA